MPRRDWYCEDVLTGNIEVNTIWEDENVLSFDHPRSVEPIHVTIIPKQHITSIMEEGALNPDLWMSFVNAVQNVARIKQVDEEGFRLKTGARAPGVTPHTH